MRYYIEQRLPDGSFWRSPESFEGDTRHAAQNVIAGWLSGQPRRAVREDGVEITAVDGQGRLVRPGEGEAWPETSGGPS